MGNSNKELNFNEDYVWMSYRYCIGRRTIASHMHAGQIANDVYGKLTDARSEFMAKDINEEIYNKLNWSDWLHVDRIYNITHFKPLDALYSCFSREGIDSMEKLRKIKSIELYYDEKSGEWKSEVYFYHDGGYENFRSLWDITDLEVWQRLANLLDLSTHKWCKLIDGSVVEYYEYPVLDTYGGEWKYKTIKCPITGYHNFSVCKYIPDDNILEDNIEKPI